MNFMSTPKQMVHAVLGCGLLALIAFAALMFPTHSASPADNSLKTALAATQASIPTEAGKANFLKQSNNLTQRVDAELVDLDSQIISCDANVDGIASAVGSVSGSCINANAILADSVKGKYLSGQCCSALMDTKEYHKNLEKLQAYKSMPDIILDPMHTPVALAKKWIDYDKATTLGPAEQKIYDDAYAISKEKPCCCKCWHYYVNEGIAKKMIRDGMFDAQQIAEYWDASDICGA
jgi:predicted membrane-bound mannosyltransferase